MQLKLLQDLDFVEKLEKAEMYKKTSGTTLDPMEMRIGLQIVPKTVMKFLTTFLHPIEIGGNKDISLDFVAGTGNRLQVTKHGPDVYSGEIYKEGKILSEFKYRSLPGVGIILMSTFELYDIEDLELARVTPADDEAFRDKSLKLDEMIEEKLRLMCLVEAVVEKKLSERNAVEQLLNARLSSIVAPTKQPVVLIEEKPIQTDIPEILQKKATMKKLKLQEFLENKKKKKQPKLDFKIEKAEASCLYCNQSLFTPEGFSGCVCLGEDQSNTILLAKTEQGLKVSFHKSWDIYNIQLVLEALKKRA